jgi:hypothetical protein
MERNLPNDLSIFSLSTLSRDGGDSNCHWAGLSVNTIGMGKEGKFYAGIR